MTATTLRRALVRVHGTVQGVGFRPYVYRLAGELGLSGYVLNDARGVLLEVEGDDAAVQRFLTRLAAEAPPLASVESVDAESRELVGETGFRIVESARGEPAEAQVTPDTATCADYPFINCTNCGPRFTIVRGMPHDRPFTTMAGFRMCELCQAEYDDPADRRFHAQPNACPACGPAARLLDRDGRERPGDDPLLAAAAALAGGAIVAIKGIGGFHLACRADDGAAVAALRARKHREDKPFALMAGSPEAAGALVQLGRTERTLLESGRRPIVLAPRLPTAEVAPAVAPGAPELGVMLPYSPLHHLLLADVEELGVRPAVLVMTSGNVSDEPIAFRDDEALARLGGIADLLLVHDRPIETRTDDSVVRVVATPGGPQPTVLRRSRGRVPGALPLPGASGPAILACGAELKNTFCLARGGRAWVSHHIGDLENFETLTAFTDGVEHLQRLFAVKPEVVAHDLHPEYLSTKYALEREGVELVGVQHHHAHMAAALAEYGQSSTAIGAIFDGTGLGSDGTLWGGELLFGGIGHVQRVGHLLPVRLPGGAAAIRQPWRMACAWLAAATGDPEPPLPASLRGGVDERAWRQVARLAAGGPNSPLTSSMGRLFDAVAALCGLRAEVSYEGQAAIELEAACEPGERGSYTIAVGPAGGALVLDPREAIAAIAADLARGDAAGAVAGRFHAAVASATVRACAQAALAGGTDLVVLSGGVFQNRRLLEATAAGLHAQGLRVLVPEQLPVSDGGISYGQAAVAARRLAG